MVSFLGGLSWISMCVPIYTKCSMCKYYHYTNKYNDKCKKVILLNNEPYIVKNPQNYFIEDGLYVNIEYARYNEDLCGINASFYERRLK